MTLIRVRGVSHTYESEHGQPIDALHDVDLDIEQGEYLAIVGHNGSGKSTLAKCLNGLLLPSAGAIEVNGMNTREAERVIAIRSTVAIVLQHPENQFVASTVREEVAFGPENLGVPHPELAERVEHVLRAVGLWSVRDAEPSRLSAGQKARLAIADMLAMEAACLVLDEATAMLDPLARGRLLVLLRSLNSEGMTLIVVTHHMEEVAEADRALVLHEGRLRRDTSPTDLFSDRQFLAEMRLDLPAPARIAQGLQERGAPLPQGILTPRQLADALMALEREAL